MLSYNCEKYLVQAIGSVLQFSNTELILIDPGSTDRSQEICNLFLELYPTRVKLVLKSDSGPAEGLNNGLKMVSGDIVGVLNGDDFYLPGALDVVVSEFVKDDSIDIFQGSGYVSNEITKQIKYVYPSVRVKEDLRSLTLGGCVFFHPGVFIKVQKFGHLSYNIENRINWDMEHFAEMLLLNPKVKRSSTPLAIFRITKDSITGSGRKVQERLERELRIVSMLGIENHSRRHSFLLILLKANQLLKTLLEVTRMQLRKSKLK